MLYIQYTHQKLLVPLMVLNLRWLVKLTNQIKTTSCCMAVGMALALATSWTTWPGPRDPSEASGGPGRMPIINCKHIKSLLSPNWTNIGIYYGGVLWATAEINTSVPAGVYLFPNPQQRFALWIWPGTIQVSRSRWMPSFIHSFTTVPWGRYTIYVR